MKNIKTSILFIVVLAIIAFSLRGNFGNPAAINLQEGSWKENGPFELSPERGRFALLYSLVEDKSFFFSTELARFTTPDLGYKNGHYVSLFAPAVSYITSVGYIIGKYFGISQVGAFATIALFAFFNGLLIRALAKKLGANNTASNLAMLIYLFATPSFAYSVTLYQHQISTFLILASLNLLISTPSFLKLFLIWSLCALSIPVDYPNLVLMAPIGIGAISWLGRLENEKNKLQLNFKPVYLVAFIGLVFPLIFFFWFNYNSYGNPLQFSGTINSVDAIDQNGIPTSSRLDALTSIDKIKNPTPHHQRSAVSFFKTRQILSGLYIHLLSPDRGILYFTPVILFGLFGIIIAYKKRLPSVKILFSVIGANLLLYSMWGDPWGGWAFGSRYLIPSYAILSIFIAIFLTEYGKKILYVLPFWALAMYSVFVNTAGALSTSAMPPKVQVLELERISGTIQKYTYERNLDMLKSGNSKSFVYNTFLKKNLTAFQFYQIIAGLISLTIAMETISLLLTKSKNEN